MALNPKLIHALAAVAAAEGAGDVSIINPGQPLEGYYEDEVSPSSKQKVTRLRIVRRGEGYVLNCLFCGDRRHRMVINHRYGLHDDKTGYNGTELWKCYNEECQGNSDYRWKLWLKVETYLNAPSSFLPKIRAPRVVPVQPGRLPPCEFPGLLADLRDLPDDHKAIEYVRFRKFDPTELAVTWKVGYAVSVPARTKGAMAQDRLICPVHLDGIMVGYQARFIGDIDWKAAGVPKYMTYFPKSQTLYGIDESDDQPLVVLVEGVFDVWRYGFGAVSPLGKTLSPDQTVLLANHLKGRPLVVVPDTDDPASFDAFVTNAIDVNRQSLRLGLGPVTAGIAVLPDGLDPAAVSRKFLRDRVTAAVTSAMTFDQE